MSEERRQLGLRLRSDVVKLLDEIDRKQGVNNRTATLEWMILQAGGDLEVQEMLRKMWVHDLATRFGADTPVSILVSGGEIGPDGTPAYTARATIGGQEVDTLAAEASEMDRGGLTVTVRNPKNDNFPFLVFDRYTADQLAYLLEETGWEGSRDILSGLARKVSELATIPILHGPGDRTPKDHARTDQ